MEKYRHIAFCALVSLGMHAREHACKSYIHENIYILRWLTTARQKKRFSPAFSPYLDKLMDLTRQQMSTVSMKKKLESFYAFSLPESVEKTEFYRFRLTIEQLDASGYHWFNLAASDLNKKILNYKGKGIFTEKSAFSCSFSNDGKQVAPVRMIIIKMDDEIINEFLRNNFTVTCENNSNILWSALSM